VPARSKRTLARRRRSRSTSASRPCRTLRDANGDFQQQDSEKKTSIFNLAARCRTSRIRTPTCQDTEGDAGFAIADADALSDAVFGNEANVLLFIDAVRWLGGEESFMGAITSTEDVKIEHTKQKDLVLFYSTILLGTCDRHRAGSPQPSLARQELVFGGADGHTSRRRERG